MIVNSCKNKRHVMTKFFVITQINQTTNCLTLKLLLPCSLCCDKDVLIPVDKFITIDMNCLCGYQFIPNICIRECSHPLIHIKDCICGPFTIPTGKDGMILWQSNLPIIQYGFINLHIEKGIEDSLKLRIYSNNLTEDKIYQLTGQKSYEFFVTGYSVIKILRSNIETELQGTFDIKWQSVME